MTDLEPVAAPLPTLPGGHATDDPYWSYLNSLDSAESKRTMRGVLDRIAKILTEDDSATGEGQPWHGLRHGRVMELREMLISKGYSPTHINKHLIAVRRVLEECWLLDLMSAEDYQKARTVKNVKGSRELAGRNIGRDELYAMLRVCAEADGVAAIRDAALMAVLYSTGIRRFEAAGALIEKYDHSKRTIRIIGKRNNERTVYLMPDAVTPLDRWLVVVGTRRGPMFRPVHKTGNVGEGALTPRAIGYIVDRTRKKAGLAPLATHDFRRTFIGDFIDAGGDLAQAQQLAGHASATTTVRYDRRPEETLRAAVDRMSLPTAESLREAEPLPHQEASDQ